MTKATCNLYTAKELKELDPKLLMSLTHIRIKLSVTIFRDGRDPENLDFIYRAELLPFFTIEEFWEQLRFLTQNMYEKSDFLYQFSKEEHNHVIHYQLDWSSDYVKCSE